MWGRNSLHAGRKPSTLLWDEVSSHNKLAARAVKVAWARIADHLAMRAAVTAWRNGSGLWRALALAKWRMNPAASSLHRPPSSMPKTTKRQRPGWTSSGYVLSLDDCNLVMRTTARWISTKCSQFFFSGQNYWITQGMLK